MAVFSTALRAGSVSSASLVVPAANIEPSACGLAQPLRVCLCSGTEDENSTPKHLDVLRKTWEDAGATVKVMSWKGGHKMPPDNDPCFKMINEFI